MLKSARICAFLLFMGPMSVSAAQKGMSVVGIEPLPASARSAGSAGVFIGVNDFEVDRSLAPLRFAVNDAVAQAHLFVEELGLIPPQNCRLLLSGSPGTDEARGKLEALKALGVRPQRASRTAILQSLLHITGQPMDAADLLVLSISTHGFEEKGVGYVMPLDGSRALLSDSGVSLLTIQDRVAGSKAGKKLLLVDACRETVEEGGRGGPGAMGEAFSEAFAKARGMSVLLSCSRGQYSLEREELGHGVFTYHLLKALGGAATADGEGYITLGSVADYLKGTVPDWVRRTNPSIPANAAQQPSFREESGDARAIPLAVSKASAEAQRALTARRAAALDKVFELRRKNRSLVTADQQAAMELALDTWEGEKLEEFMGMLDDVDPANPTRAKLFLGWWIQNSSPPPVGTLVVEADSEIWSREVEVIAGGEVVAAADFPSPNQVMAELPSVNPPAAMTREQFLTEVISIARRYKSTQTHFAPDIPAGKLKNVRKVCEVPADDQVLVLEDMTVWGTAKACLLLTQSGVYFHNGVFTTTPGRHYISYPALQSMRIYAGGLQHEAVIGNSYVNTAGGGTNPHKIVDMLTAIQNLLNSRKVTF